MKIHCNYTGIKGFLTVYDHAVRYRYKITETAKKRMKVLVHWEKHGMESTVDAFGILRRTLFNWKRAFKQGGGNPKLLIPRSELPKTNEDDLGIGEFWRRLKDLETETSTQSRAEKLHPLLLDFAILSNLNVPAPPLSKE